MDFSSIQKNFMVDSYVNRGVTFVKGDGCYLIDNNGERYLDLMTNYGVNILGHNHPYITKKLQEQFNKLTTLHCSFSNDVRAMASQKIVERCGKGLRRVYFSNSGAEAIESALKFAVLATGKRKFISCFGSFHGKTLGALSATQNPKYRAPFEPLLWQFFFIPYNDLEALKNLMDETFSAFIVEPIQGEGGVNIPDNGFLKDAKRICEERDVLMIIDEIQTGLGRTGSFLASEEEIEKYDIVCLGKGLAGGLPVGVTIVSEKISKKITRSVHSSTFGGNPLVCAGINATLDLLNYEILEKVRDMGNYFIRKIKEIKSDLILEVRGKGLMLGIEVREKRDLILKALQRRKILSIPAGENVIRFLPPYIIEKEQIDEAVDVLSDILKFI